MGRLESLLAQVTELAGDGVTVESDRPVVVHSAGGGDVPQPWTLSSAELNDALQDVLDEQQQIELMVGNLVEFKTTVAGREWSILCEPRQEGVRLRARLNNLGKKSTRRGQGVEVPELTFEASNTLQVREASRARSERSGRPTLADLAAPPTSRHESGGPDGIAMDPSSALIEDFAFSPGNRGRHESDTAVPLALDDDPFSASFLAPAHDILSTATRGTRGDAPVAGLDRGTDAAFADPFESPHVELPPSAAKPTPAPTRASPAAAAAPAEAVRPPSGPLATGPSTFQPRGASAHPRPSSDRPTRDDLVPADPSAKSSDSTLGDGTTGEFAFASRSPLSGAAREADATTGNDARQTPSSAKAAGGADPSTRDAHGGEALVFRGAGQTSRGAALAADWICQPRTLVDSLHAAVALVEPGTLCFVHRESVLPCVERESPLCFVDEDDPLSAGDATRGRARGTSVVLVVDALPRWLDWVLRRLEEGHRVFVETRACTPDGAMRGLLGTNPGRRAELWLAVHQSRAIVPEVGGYRVWSLDWEP